MAVSTHRRRIPWLSITGALVVAGLTAVLLYKGWSFYALSLEDRVEHPDFRKLRPSGLLGNGYGWVAALLVVMNLSYLVRRRLAGSRLGSMRMWLDIHVFTGLTAATLVTFHSAFQLRTPIATISAASLGVVVLTGLIGRFLCSRSPPPRIASGCARRSTAIEAALPRPARRARLPRSMPCRVRWCRPTRRCFAACSRSRRGVGSDESPRGARADPAAACASCPAPQRKAVRRLTKAAAAEARARRAWPRCCDRGAASTGSSRCSCSPPCCSTPASPGTTATAGSSQ